MISIHDYYPEIKSFNITSFDELKAVLNFSKEEMDLVEKAYLKASELHGKYSPPRKSGEPYITHPLSVAYILAKFGADCNTVCAGLLHDTVEDTPYTLEQLAKDFNDDIAEIVDGVTKINNKDDKKEAANATHRKILEGVKLHGINGLKAILVKLADRIHNIPTLNVFKKEEKKLRIANETMDLYVPLARIFGVYGAMDFLSDAALYYKDPESFETYYEIRKEIKRDSKGICDELYDLINNDLNDIEGLDYIFKVKNLYGIYKKVNRGKELHEIDDLIGMKFIMPKKSDCYRTLGSIHEMASPIGRSVVDFIASPKPNGYQSLNTLVNYGGINIQARIRTNDMEQNNRLGILSSNNSYTPVMLNQMRKSLDKIDSDVSNSEFISVAEKSILRPKIGVIAPTGKMVLINDGDTAYDYAYKMKLLEDSNIDKVYVNGNKVDQNTILCEGDNVFILTKPKG